jgi:threonine dehydrogenase-like Zn-dependent dehydrogenase
MTEQTITTPKRRYARQPSAAEGAPATLKSSTHAMLSKRPTAQSKINTVIALLERDEGATLDCMVEATGWLPHTTRAAMTGLKKRGHAVSSTKAEDVRTYRILKTNAESVDSSAHANAEVAR